MQPKSKLAAGLLGLLLGCFGVHNFILGYTVKAILQLVVTCCAIFMAVLIVIPYVGWAIYLLALASVMAVRVWTLIESIQILTRKDYYDARGVRLAWPSEMPQ